LATLEWVPWFNQLQLLEPIRYIPQAEDEANYCRQFDSHAATVEARLKPNEIHESRDGSALSPESANIRRAGMAKHLDSRSVQIRQNHIAPNLGRLK